jgi:SAM-dependent methyltransferase
MLTHTHPSIPTVRRDVSWLLRVMDRVFPPNPTAFRSGEQQTKHEIVKAAETMGGYLAELGGPRARDLDVLDFGCGWGGETLWLAERVRSVCGVDVNATAIAQARTAAATVGNCRFEWSEDGRLPFPDASFDAVLSTDTFEHVMDLDLAFGEIARVLRPGGSLLTRFGPLFFSPQGYHLYWACQVPYAHLLFGLKSMAAMRTRRGGSATTPATWQDLGLNGKRFDDYARSVKASGLEVVRFAPIPVKGLKMAAKVPVLKNLFIFGVDCHVRRPL